MQGERGIWINLDTSNDFGVPRLHQNTSLSFEWRT